MAAILSTEEYDMKKYMVSIIFLVLGVGSFIAYTLMGAEVLADGTLKEPFYLLPVGYTLLFSAVLAAGISFVTSKKR